MRVVFDTNIVVSALLFADGNLKWLRAIWRQGYWIPVVSQDTVKELLRVLAYPKFRLTPDEQNDLLTDFLPYVDTVVVHPDKKSKLPICRDKTDQKFLLLAEQAGAGYLITGDTDLLALNDQTDFSIITPAEFQGFYQSGPNLPPLQINEG